MKLLDYLKLTKTATNHSLSERLVHVVIGNESCDPDSMVSALALAFHYSSLEKYKNSLVIPMLNKAQMLFSIRTENVFLLDKYNIPEQDLIFSDSINLQEIQRNSKLTITLVDHHVLPANMKFLKQSVTEVIDHRPVDTSEAWSDDIYQDIQTVGSCCTLITTHIHHHSLSQIILGLLLDVICYDTIAFSDNAGKTKPMDLEVADILERALSIVPSNADTRQQRFQDIYDAHRDIAKLTTEQLLYKDLKILENIYIPGLPILVETYAKRRDFENILSKFCKDNNVEILLLMGLEVNDGNVKRDLGIYTSSKTNNLEMVNRIENTLLSSFEVAKIETHSPIQYYQQINPTLSRKQLMPLLKQALKM